jgi:hypothetical protein
MDKEGDPTLEEILAGIDKARTADAKGFPPSPSRARSDTPLRAPKTDTPAFKFGTPPRLDPPPARPTETMDEVVRSAMLAAADAILQPWLYKHFPRIVEQQMSALLNERVEQMATATQQQVTDEVNQRLGAALKHSVAAIEKGLATSISRQIADALNQRLDAAVNKHVAAIEARMASALGHRVAEEVNQRLERTVSKHFAAVEDRLAHALDERVIDAVNQQLEPAATKHVAAVEERIAASASRQVKDEISRRLKRIADE